jgi:quinol monooxygenase YgiN
MFVVTVSFKLFPDKANDFQSAVLKQARNSLNFEVDCHVFDVCNDPDDATSIFLYEKYVSRAAFDVHLESDHFAEFDRLVAPWVQEKSVNTWIEAEDRT